MKRVSTTEYRTRNGTTERIELFHYECENGHTAAADTGFCYECAHLQNNTDPRSNKFYEKYGLECSTSK